MNRKTANEERLEQENAALRRVIARHEADPGDLPVAGCGDHSCVVARPQGMGTNGGCRCDERAIRRALAYFRRLAAFREETIRTMRAAPSGDGGAEDERAAVVAHLRHEARVNFDDGSPAHEALTNEADWVERGGHRKARG